MTAQRPHLIVSETKEKLPILIIDKIGVLGEEIAEKIKDQFFVVLVTGKEIKHHNNIVCVHYGKKIPKIPDEQYSTMVTVFHGEKSTIDILPSIAKKANEANAKLLFISSIHDADNKIKKILDKSIFAKVTRIFYGDVFGKEDYEDNLLTDYIEQVRVHRKIEIPGSGLLKSYPVLFDDLNAAILDIMFGTVRKASTIFILPKHGFTQLTIARAFQKLDPLIKINFKKEKNKEGQYNLPEDAEYYFKHYELDKKLKKVDLSKKELKHRGKIKKLHKSKKIKLPNKYLPLFIFFLFFLLPIFSQLLLLLGGSFFLSESVKTSSNYNFLLAKKYNTLSRVSFIAAGLITQNLSGINPIILMQKEPVIQKARIGESLAEAESDILDSVILIKNIYEEKSTNPKNDFLEATAKIKNSLVTVQKLKAEDVLPESLEKKINPLDDSLVLLGNTIDTLPEILGFNQKKKYLILFQNNMELRPGGGFIGSYATVDIQNGKIGKLKIQDVYDADGKLSVHIEPPFALRRYLGTSHLFLRDSNFDVGFISNAKKALNFLELETGEKADAVIAMDTNFVKNLISVFGPLYIPDFKETVTAENFYIVTETRSEKNFFPGSTQKKDFLRALYNSLETKIFENKKIPLSLLSQKITQGFKQKHLLIAFPDSEFQTVFSTNNLSGSLIDNRQKEDNKLLDFFGINEANLGMNKTNLYINRSIEQKVQIDDHGNVKETVNIAYENSSDKNSAFGGDYKNYLRMILPSDAVLESVEVNGTVIPTTNAVTDVNKYTQKGFKPPPQLEVEKTHEEGKAIYGFLTIIPTGTSQKISITYSLQNVINLSKTVMQYDLYLLKQPGTNNDSYSFSLVYPNAYQPIQIEKQFSDVGGKLVYTDNLSEDKNLTLKFSKK